MDKVLFCKDCRKLILQDYRFCPWCGCELKQSQPWDESINETFEALETHIRHSRNKKDLLRLEKELNLLEEEINLIISQEKR